MADAARRARTRHDIAIRCRDRGRAGARRATRAACRRRCERRNDCLRFGTSLETIAPSPRPSPPLEEKEDSFSFFDVGSRFRCSFASRISLRPPLPVQPTPNRPPPSGPVRRAARSPCRKRARSSPPLPCRSSHRRGSGLPRSCHPPPHARRRFLLRQCLRRHRGV